MKENQMKAVKSITIVAALAAFSVGAASNSGNWPVLREYSGETARRVVMACPFICFGGYPLNYLDSPMLEIIKNLPATYDETVVLRCSSIGNCVADEREVVRQHGKGNFWYNAKR